MNLIIDQGNTATKLVIYGAENQLITKVVFAKNEQLKAEEWMQKEQDKFNCILVSSVTNQRLVLPEKHTIYLKSDTPLPLKNGYLTPKTLGKDRIANAVAIWTKNPAKNSLSIDLGTCIKYDLVTAEGVYLGGNISPGMRLRYQALNSFTDQLPLLNFEPLILDYGTTTETSIRNGVQQAIVHEIKGFIERYIEQFGALTIFMSGGDLKYFDKGFKNTIFASSIAIDHNLTVFGLNEILKYNVKH